MRRRPWDGDTTWPPAGSGRVRVVVEDVDGAARWACARVLERAGYEVTTCGGPDANGGVCRLVDTGHCGLVAGADVVVCALNLRRPENAAVLDALRARAAHLPTVVVIPEPDVARNRDLLAGCVVVAAPPTARELVDAVARARAR